MPRCRFTVTWTRPARNDLARLWLASSRDDRSVITTTVDALDQELGRFPHERGLPVLGAGNLRTWDPFPIQVYYRVRPEDRHTEVILVRRAPLSDDFNLPRHL